MLIFPAIDILGGRCVRLTQGAYDSAEQVAADPLETARAFRDAGAQWLHAVDLDGAKTGERVNAAVFELLAGESGLRVEVGGGIRDMAGLTYYLERGVSRCILGSAALKSPAFVREAVRTYGGAVAVGIDAREGYVAAEGWLETSRVHYLELARQMEDAGVQHLIFTDIGRDGTLTGPNLAQLDALSAAVSCNVIASGGIRDASDIRALRERRLYGAICGKSLYGGTLDLRDAIDAGRIDGDDAALDRFFAKSALIPAIVQDTLSGEVLMLAYMNRGALQRTLESGETWFWSRSRREYWHKGATSGHVQRVRRITGDCDSDTLLIQVAQTGAACHTGARSCFFDTIQEG